MQTHQGLPGVLWLKPGFLPHVWLSGILTNGGSLPNCYWNNRQSPTSAQKSGCEEWGGASRGSVASTRQGKLVLALLPPGCPSSDRNAPLPPAFEMVAFHPCPLLASQSRAGLGTTAGGCSLGGLSQTPKELTGQPGAPELAAASAESPLCLAAFSLPALATLLHW